MLGSPELDAVLQLGFHQSAVALLDTLLLMKARIHSWLSVLQVHVASSYLVFCLHCPQVFLLGAALNPFSIHMCLCIHRLSQEKQKNMLQSLLLILSYNPLINCLLEGKSETGILHWMSAMTTKLHIFLSLNTGFVVLHVL